jgi:hypothetical protein
VDWINLTEAVVPWFEISCQVEKLLFSSEGVSSVELHSYVERE